MSQPTPSPAVVRHLVATNSPELLEFMDEIKKMGAKLVALEIPRIGLAIGKVSTLGRAALDAVPVWQAPPRDTAQEWKEIKQRSKGAKPARKGSGRRAHGARI